MKPILFALLLLGAGGAVDARATSCSLGAATTGTVNFGAVNPLLSNDTFADGNSVAVTCNFTALAFGARLCFSAGVGTTSASTAARAMGAGGYRMNYNLYTDSGHSQVWSDATTSAPTSILLAGPVLSTGSASTSFSYYAKLPGGQTTVSTVGNANTLYSENYSTTVRVDIAWGLLSTLLVNCPIAAPSQTLYVPLTAQATPRPGNYSDTVLVTITF